MGLFFAEVAGSDFKLKAENAVLHELGCKACPLNDAPGDMPATGAAHPLVYVLGEAPGRNEIEEGRQFVGKSGQLLREFLPEWLIPKIRWNNVIRSHPPHNRDPERVEIECCRPSVVADIVQSKPRVIFGFGNVPLNWVSGMHGVKYWRGRKMPVQIGSHVCWFYSFYHPSFLLRPQSSEEDERMTALDIARALDELEHLPKPEVHTPEMARANVDCLTDIRRIEKALQWASRQPHVGLDYETNCLRPYENGAKILTAAVGTLERAFAFPFEHPGAKFTRNQVQEVRELWQRFLLRAPCRKVVHHLSFEMEWSAYEFGSEVLRAQPWEDTATAAAIVDERKGKTKPGCFSLEFLVQQHFGFNVKKVSNVDRKRLEDTPLDVVLSYNGIDAKYHDGLWEKLWGVIKQEKLEEPYQLAVRRVPTVVLSQIKGVPVDQTRVKQLQKKYKKLVEDTEDAIANLKVVKDFAKHKGHAFNPYSNPDIIFAFDKLLRRDEIIVIDKYSREEKYSANEEVLTQIDHPLAKHILALRSASGTKSKYVDALLADDEDSVIFPDGLIHTHFGTYIAETGRASSEDPNLQNFPKRDAETKEVRSSIVALKGTTCLSFDYGQIEARVIAMFTKDKNFCKALWERYDVHGDWAERIAYDYPHRVGGKNMLKDKKVMKDFRTDIKNQWTFPLFFGAKLSSVAGYLNIPERVLSKHYDDFWDEYEGVHQWQQKLLKFYREYGYVECLTKRRRRGPLSLNQVINSPVQGTAAEIVFDAMSRLSEIGDIELQPEINIHDDLTFLRVPDDGVDVIAEKIIDTMVNVPFSWVNVPIQVEMSCGPNWADLEEVGVYASDTWRK